MNPNVDEKKGFLQILEETPASKLPDLKQVADKFKRLFCIVHLRGNMTPAGIRMAESFYEAEKLHFLKILSDNPELQTCTKLSLYGCWMDVAINRLSFDPSFKHLYLVPYSHNVAKKGQPDKWEKRASLEISGYGELLLRQMQGQVKYADNPVLVYEGDEFKHGTRSGSAFVEHESILHKGKKEIVACYLKITRIDDTVDYKVITLEDVERFKAYATKKNKGRLPDSWDMGAGGMWQAKCIKHAFKNYPKIRMGNFSKLLTEAVAGEDENNDFDYGLPEDETGAPGSPQPTQPGSNTPPPPAPPAPPPPANDDISGPKKTEKTVQKFDDEF